MPKLFLIPEVVSQKIGIYLNTEHHELAVEIRRQLESHEHAHFVKKVSEADVCIYLAGFDPPSLSETLSHTSQLYEDLKQIKSDHHKFILVVKNPSSHLSRTAITLTNQFAHNYGLNHEVVEYDHSISVSQLAQAIIRKFIYDHSPTHHHPSVQPPSPQVHTQTSDLPRAHKSRLWFAAPLLVFVPWLVSGLLLASQLVLTSCLYTHSVCAPLSRHLSTVFRYSSRFSPGASLLSTQLGLPPAQYNEVLHTITRLDSVSSLSSQKSAVYLDGVFSKRPLPQSMDLLASLSETDSLLNQLQADLRSLYLHTPTHISSFEKLALRAGDTRHTLNTFLPKLPEFLAGFSSGKKTYLVALQDNWELRAGGGLVETFLKVDIENGQVDQFQPFSTKDTDKLLKGSILPPSDFQDLTDETQWYMRDASWDPDIKNTLEKVAWFAENEINHSVDGVILLDLNTLKSLVQIIGSVQVGESQVAINSQNFSSIYQSQLNSSENYSEYLESLLSAVFSQLGNLDLVRNQRVVKLLYNQLKDRQIFITGLSEGEIGLPECRSFVLCLADYTYPVSSNMSGSKTNFYLKKSQTTSITLSDTKQTTRHMFAYKYEPPTNSWVGPNHQEYLRVYVPGSITSDYQVSIDGIPVSSTSIHTSVVGGLKYLGVPFTVNKNQEVKIDFVYHTPVPNTKQFHYQLDIPNQPGVIGDQVTISLDYPPTWAALVDKAASVADAGHLEYNYAHPKSFQLNIDFSKP